MVFHGFNLGYATFNLFVFEVVVMSMMLILSEYPVKIIESGDMSQATLTSDIINIKRYSDIGLQCKWTGSAVGTFVVEATNNEEDATSFVALEMDEVVASATSTNPFLININNCPYRGLRIKYTRTSGSGTLDVWASAKAGA